ncbi:MAG: AAA family ATPase [Alphaproteobacteria bacterium]|nr:AAA family ATPase [Alphaproteobacteria bacterium]
MRSRILVVASDVALRARLARLLTGGGYAVELAESLAHAQRIGVRGLALALVAVDALTGTGDDPFAELQGAVRKVLLVGTGSAAERFGVPVVDAGDEAALLAGVGTALRPVAAEDGAAPLLRFAGYTFDIAGHSLTNGDGREIQLTRGEFALLHELVQRPGRVLSRDHLLQVLAGREAEPFDRSVDMLVVRLRRKVEPDPKHPTLIVTVPGSGYKFAPRVQCAEAVAEMAAEPVPGAAPPVAERRQVTVLAMELVAAAAGALPDDPEELRVVLEVFHDRAAAVVTQHGGTLAPSLRREALAYFGYPVGHEDAAERAIRAGLALADDPGALAGALPAGLGVRAGIATGLVVADSAGEVVGEPPSAAARLSTLAEPGQIVLDAATQRLAGGLFAYRDLGLVAIKGFATPLQAWRVLGPSQLATRSELLHAATLPPLIGREDELDLLVRAWQQAKSGRGRLMLVTGEAGIGKSRLLAALEERVAGDAHVSLRYFCAPLFQDSALHPVIARWEQEAGFARGDSAATRLRKLEAILAPSGLPPADTALIAAMLSVPAGAGYPPPDANPQRQRERTVAVLERRLIGMTRRQPVLMLLEDAHWADPSTLDLIESGLRQLATSRALLVVSARPEFTASWIGRPEVTVLTLSRLNRRQASALAAQAAGERPLAPALLHGVVAQADGVPLFIEELTEAVLEDSAAGAAEGHAAIAVPATLQASLMARLDRVPTGRHVAQVGAAIGRDFSHELLRAVAEQPAATVDQGLAELVRAGLVLARGAPPDARYSFKHALVQDAAYASLLRGERRRLHARIVAVLERGDADGADDAPELLARHCAEAGLDAKAAAAWLRAGTAALHRAAIAEALAHLAHGLTAAAAMEEGEARRRLELDLWIARIKALMSAEGHASRHLHEAFRHAQDLCEQLGAASQLVTVLYGQWSHAFVRGDFAEALRQAHGLLALADTRGDTVCRLIGLLAAGLTSLPMGAYADVRGHLTQGLALFDPQQRAAYAAPVIGDPRVLMLDYLAWGLMCEGRIGESRRAIETAIAEARALGQVWTLAQSLSSAAFFAATLDSAEAGLRWAEELRQIANEHGLAYFAASAAGLVGWCLALRGEPQQGCALLRKAGDGLRDAGSLLWVPSFIRMEAEAIGAMGRIEDAHARLDEAFALAADTGAYWDLPELHRVRGGLFAAAADPGAAERALRQAVSSAQTLGAKLFELRAAIVLAGVLAGQGRHAEAAALLLPPLDALADEDARDLRAARTLLGTLRAPAVQR